MAESSFARNSTAQSLRALSAPFPSWALPFSNSLTMRSGTISTRTATGGPHEDQVPGQKAASQRFRARGRLGLCELLRHHRPDSLPKRLAEANGGPVGLRRSTVRTGRSDAGSARSRQSRSEEHTSELQSL